MANELDQDPIVIDTNATDVVCPRLRAVQVDGGTCLIVDSTSGHRIYSTDVTSFADINVTVPDPYLIDVTVGGGAIVYIYLGSGPR
jgi:hypothetical protein